MLGQGTIPLEQAEERAHTHGELWMQRELSWQHLELHEVLVL